MTAHMKARPTVYMGITMRSRLEAGFAAWLDEKHFDWEYEPCAFASPDGQYLPDFRLNDVFVSWRHEPMATVYAEVKPETYRPAGNTDHRCACPVHAGRARAQEHSRACQEANDQGIQDMVKFIRQTEIIIESEPGALLILMQPGKPAWIAWELGKEGPTGPWRQPIHVQFIARPEGRLGLGLASDPEPWPREYWKPGRTS